MLQMQAERHLAFLKYMAVYAKYCAWSFAWTCQNPYIERRKLCLRLFIIIKSKEFVIFVYALWLKSEYQTRRFIFEIPTLNSDWISRFAALSESSIFSEDCFSHKFLYVVGLLGQNSDFRFNWRKEKTARLFALNALNFHSPHFNKHFSFRTF